MLINRDQKEGALSDVILFSFRLVSILFLRLSLSMRYNKWSLLFDKLQGYDVYIYIYLLDFTGVSRENKFSPSSLSLSLVKRGVNRIFVPSFTAFESFTP